MGFLYPFFLIAGLTLAIPLAIHLFNLRKYKTVLFPHTRFLREIQLRSRRSSEVKYKWLLALRMLFLAALVLAFAQPLFHKKDAAAAASLQVIFIDNSASMSLKKGARSLLDMARDAARQQMQSAPAGTKFLLLSSDKPVSYQALPADKAIAALNSIDISPVSKSSAQTFATVQSLMQSEASAHADLYYYSDFQRSGFEAKPEAGLTRNITFHAIAVQAPAPGNVYIDTAYLAAPVLQAGVPNALIVRSRLADKAPQNAPVLQLSINGQVRSGASLAFNNQNISSDTLSFSIGEGGWQRILLYVNDASLRFDDTFRLAARVSPGLNVLVLNEGNPSPFITAAFRSYNGFRVTQESSAASQDWHPYNLVILNGITRPSQGLVDKVKGALAAGQSIALFPGKTSAFDGLNTLLKAGGDIRIAALDTAAQEATTLQSGADLVRDIFESIPQNVQLPQATWHYSIASGFTANGQNVISFRSGDPLLARFTAGRGALYVSAVSADAGSGNFPSSYFFVPFLYSMAAHATGGDVFALTSGAHQQAYLPISNSAERNMVHVLAPGIDAIPPQQPSGGGLNISLDEAVQTPGFYKLAAPSGDSAIVGLNAGRSESIPDVWSLEDLRKSWPDKGATWQTSAEATAAKSTAARNDLPLWKVCAILALALLAAETILIYRRRPGSSTNTIAAS